MTNEFSVFVFLPDGSYFAEARWLEAKAAVMMAKEITERPAAKLGVIAKVLIVDGGDCAVFVWEYGAGVVFPPQCVLRPTGNN